MLRQRVAGEVEAERLLLVAQPLGLAPLGQRRVGRRLARSRRRRTACPAPPPPRRAAAAPSRGCRSSAPQQRARARLAEAVEGAGLDQALEHLVVERRGVDLARRSGRGSRKRPTRRRAARIASTAPSPTPLTAPRPKRMASPIDGERPVALVDVRRQHRDAHLAALAACTWRRRRCRRHLGGQHGGHEGHRVVRLEVGGLVGEHGVGDAVALVEAVAGEGLDVVPQLLGLARVLAARLGAGEELLLLLGHHLELLLAHRLAQHVGLAHGEAGDLDGDLHHLLLVGDDAVGLLQDRLGLGQDVAHLLARRACAG